jgi:hypothetical protein
MSHKKRKSNSAQKARPSASKKGWAETTGRIQRLSAKELFKMKEAAQRRDHANASRLNLSKGKRLIIRPSELKRAKVKWPSGKLSD